MSRADAVTSPVPTRRALRAIREAESSSPECETTQLSSCRPESSPDRPATRPQPAKSSHTGRSTKSRKAKKRTTKIRVHRSPLRALTAGLGVLAFALVLFVIGATMVVPRVLNGTAIRVASDSMAPTLVVGDVAVLRGLEPAEACSQVSIGDIVGYLPIEGNAELVPQRVVSKSVGGFADGTSCRFTVRGDTADAVDSQISPAQVRGLFAYRVPMIGTALEWVGQNRPLAIGALVVLMLGSIVASHRRPKVTIKTNSSSSRVKTETTQPSYGAQSEPPAQDPPAKKRRPAKRAEAGSKAAPKRAKSAKSDPEKPGATKPPTNRTSAAPQTRVPGETDPEKAAPEKATEPALTDADLIKWDLNLRERELALREARFAHSQTTTDSTELWATVAALVGADSQLESAGGAGGR